MKAIEKLKTKTDEIKTKIDDHSEQISNVLIAAGVESWLQLRLQLRRMSSDGGVG